MRPPALPLVLLGPLLLACASGAPPAGPGPAPVREPPEEEWPWPVVSSADGRFRLRMGPTRWNDDPGAPGGLRLDTQGTVEPLDGSTLLGAGNPLASIEAADGGPPSPAPFGWSVSSADGNFFCHGLGVDAGTTRLSLLAFEVPILRVLTWETHTFTGLGPEGAQDLPAPPFLLSVGGEEGICRVGAYRRGGPADLPAAVTELASLLGHRWAATAARVTDARGRELVCCGGAGSGGFTSGMYVTSMPGSDAPADPAIAWPVTVTLRVPREYGVERVRFEVRDLVLPPRPSPPRDRP